MKKHLYQKCLQCPWLWGCGLWWCLQWWCWLWGCSTETPADPLDSPTEIIYNRELFTFSFLLHIFPSSVALLLHPQAVCVLSIYLSASPYFLLSFLPPAHCHLSPGRVTAARNDITVTFCPIFSFHLFPVRTSPPPLPFYSRCHHYMVSAPSRKSAC